MIVSPSMSLVAAGVASGICFILFSSLRKGRSTDSKKDTKRILQDDSRCACCLKPFLVDRGVRCNDCAARSCRKGCSRWDTSDNAWHCLFCHQQRSWLKRNEKWFETFGGAIDEEDLHRYFSTAKSRVYVAGVENAATSSGLALAAESQEEANTMETVRDFVEKIVEGLIGSVDDTPIDRLYNHPEYDKLLAKYIVPLAGALARLAVALQLSLTNKPSTDPPTMAHTALRDIVERAVEEARKLPGLGSGNGRQDGRNIAEHSYEDLLATAILNKVIEKFQREQVDGNSNVLHGKPATRTKCTLSESELGLDEGVEEGCSSLEPLSQDDCSSDGGASYSRHVRNQLEPLSLTIEERIEEVTTTYSSDEDHRDNDVLVIRNTHRVPFPELGMDIIDPSQESEDSQDEPDTPTAHVDMVSPVESWEENWLFQRKRVQKQADPVAMLVPNSSADFKALIGDKDAEDTSDLSECSSAQSDEEIEKELMEAINNVVPRSPKEKEFGDTLENHRETLTNGLSNGMCEKQIDDKIVISGKTDLRNPKESDVKDNETLGAKKENKSEQISENVRNSSVGSAETETKEIKGESNTFNQENVKMGSTSVISSMIINSDTKKIEAECQKSCAESKEVIVDENIKKTEEFHETISSKTNTSTEVNKSTESTSSLTEEKVSNMPKTPTCTPTRISVTEDSLAGANDEETFDGNGGNVLNSLECAKKKLMVVDDDATVARVQEEAKENQRQKADFHNEDIQQESEYTEHYDIATQRHLDSLTKTDVSAGESELNTGDSKCREAVAFAKAESASYSSLQNRNPQEEVQLATPPRPGTIAEREHKKWENAPPIENNPYSEENIQKRLWERQYARRSSDIPGMHAELPKSNGADLEVALTPPEPDFKRFGRDYYINGAKTPTGERLRRSTSISSRPSSSLSQRSSSTGDQEQQEDTQYKEPDRLLNRSNDVKSKVAKWQNNNAETNYQSSVRRTGNGTIQSYNTENKAEENRPKRNDCQKLWDDQRVEEILENERKNNKNEINAKLNNQEIYETSGVLEAKKSNSDENQRMIRRIDLKAYGFENEFSMNKNNGVKTSSQRVVNKLDLKSFGYDGGIRRTQSNNQLDSTVTDGDFKPRIIRVTNKSNLTRHHNLRDRNDCHDLIKTQASGDVDLTQSTEALNKLPGESYGALGSLKSAKSVPNIAKCEYYSSSSNDQDDDDEVQSYTRNSYGVVNESGVIKNGNVMKVARNNETRNYNGRNGDASSNDSENDTDNSSERDQTDESNEKLSIRNGTDVTYDTNDKILPMPSVRRLAQAFSKQPESVPTITSRSTRLSGTIKERSSTPEIHIVESPRQMHSLTARSLSKKFREGLRQIPNKVTSPPASHVTMEQSGLLESPTEVVQSNGDDGMNDRDVISPGKLKSNIIFWEQMQRRS